MLKPSFEYRPDIDGLRAIAVLLVVLFHAVPYSMPGGFVGVDIFFVISGFLITGIVLQNIEVGQFTLCDFYARRCRRILPALLAMLVVTWLAVRFILPVDEFLNFSEHMLAASGFMSNYKLLKECGYFDVDALHKPLLHLWSLAVEEQFYLLWPSLLYLLVARKFKIWKFAAFILLASFLFNLQKMRMFPNEAFYLLPSRFWELLSGGLLAIVYGKVQLIRKALGSWQTHALDAAPAVLLTVFLVFLPSTPFPGWSALLPVAATLIFIYNGPDSWLNRMLSGSFFVYIGKTSYPFYLWHWPVLSIASIWLGKTPFEEIRLLLVLLSFLLAVLTWEFLEKPAQRRLFSKRSASARAGLWVKFGVTGLTISGLIAFMTVKGVLLSPLQRFHHILSRYRTYSGDWGPRGCFLGSPSAGFERFPPDCLIAPKNGAKAVMLWGDSYSATMSHGVRNFIKPYDAQLFQLGASICPPILNLDVAIRPRCMAVNNYIISKIRETKPDAVIMAANWSYYLALPVHIFPENLDYTFKELKKAGVKHIIVAGQIPLWKKPLYKTLINNFQYQIPKRTAIELADIKTIDAQMRRLITDPDIPYVSVLDKYCNKDGCLTMVGDNVATDLSTFDIGHLTNASSDYLAFTALGPVLSEILPKRSDK